MDVVALASELLTEARRANERRVLTVTGARHRCEHAVQSVLKGIDVPIRETIAVSDRDSFHCECIGHHHSRQLMGTTQSVVVLDLHPTAQPNIIGRSIGAVDGGGLAILLTPSLSAWPSHRDTFDDGLVVEPFTIDAVRGGFKRRLVQALRSHPGIAIVDVDAETINRNGITGATSVEAPPEPDPPPTSVRFHARCYDRCVTRDQAQILSIFERLGRAPVAIVISADRGRGKSSVAGIAAAALAQEGLDIGVTAPERANLHAFVDRVVEISGEEISTEWEEYSFPDGGTITILEPLEAAEAAEDDAFDVLFADEAAGLPVRTLERCLACPHVAFTTTRHGYEGAGHGFSTRFREKLVTSDRELIERQMSTPIRYARGDPIEAWVNRVLLLDARPAVEDAVSDATLDETDVVFLTPDILEDDSERLREVMGLLATAHYRTEPDDLARVLDAPNLSVVALEWNGRVVTVALVAREGDLFPQRAEAAYRGERLRGNMLPDLFCTVYRRPDLAVRAGLRIVRIATHPSTRRRGFASRLLAAIRTEFGPEISWIGTGFGATPDILAFWTENDYRPIGISASRNPASGAHSVYLLDGNTTDPDVLEDLSNAFPNRVRDSLSDVHRSVDPAVVASLLRASDGHRAIHLSDDQWRGLVAAADGPGRYDLNPGPARELVMHGLIDGELEATVEQLLVVKILQGRSWLRVTEFCDLQSVSTARRQVGHGLSLLLDRYGPPIVAEERDRLH